ncbi:MULTISPECIES: 4'-phosphopantetheinyl transferase family protein [Bacillus]|uniref:4'-phosphopantetheinyl transferase superfamily protein n=1 Tax=Bacillus cereus TaxID=1396 RepID=A0AAN5XMG3_BACCE|nr:MULTISPECIES: 4'-phosphopantetheinyl transferase superfamily protein [Bacillus cereus group]KAB2447917.1 4'-phosphopantetheinyl transferase superfamily protein [Bacillus cereus]KAB2484502.1 4'-phosphopantetheinyl transferase superfamily protein [Bacillus cereus]MCU4957133.1 4'-phosphopantetheinyl transferase superfamily protein [Bacillus cereus]PHG45627.1 4-phosphopantetheinyl transferase [Bacillus wiedmannii]
MKIYAVKITDIDEEKIERLSLLVTSDKRNKIKNFVNKKDKIRSLIGELLVIFAIGEELNIERKNITFEKNKYGKPYIKEYSNFNFNISHSGDFIVCATDDASIGIDIEEIKHIEYVDIARNFFTTIEWDYIAKEDSYDPLSRFYQVWVLKESYIKCCGMGLSIPLKSFSICINKLLNIAPILNNENNNDFKFKVFDIDPSYKMAVCSLRNEISNEIIRMEPNELINRVLLKAIN